MNTQDLTTTLTTLFRELVAGPAANASFILNGSDSGMLRSLDRLSARDASAIAPGGSSIAAHVDHVRYGLSLMNRWSAGENPFADADWSTSWRKTSVSDGEWQRLRADLQTETTRWLETLARPREISRAELNGVVGSIAHLAYHLGAIRQMNRAVAGPPDPHLAPSHSS